jgi:hypothetical protein
VTPKSEASNNGIYFLTYLKTSISSGKLRRFSLLPTTGSNINFQEQGVK